MQTFIKILESYRSFTTLSHVHDSGNGESMSAVSKKKTRQLSNSFINVCKRELYIKYNSLMLAQENFGTVKILGVVIEKSGHGFNITL